MSVRFIEINGKWTKQYNLRCDGCGLYTQEKDLHSYTEYGQEFHSCIWCSRYAMDSITERRKANSKDPSRKDRSSQ